MLYGEDVLFLYIFDGISFMKRDKRQFKYQLIHDALAAKIAAGLVDDLPSEEGLCREFDAGRNIVRQALQLLVEEGYIIKERGKRTRVCRKKFADPLRDAKLVLLQRHDYLGGGDNPVYAAVISGLLELAALRGCHLELLYLPGRGNVEYEKFVAGKLAEADGIFLTVIRRSEVPPGIGDILASHPRTVCVDHCVGVFGKYSVGTDNYAGGLLAAEKVFAAGKTSPVIYGCGDSFASYTPMIERAMGFRDACRAGGAGFDRAEQFVLNEVPPEFHTVSEAIGRLLARRPRTDALFVLSDIAAFHAVRALRAMGKRVPEDIGVIGFDGVVSGGEYKCLASIRQNVEAVAERSFFVMEKLLRGEVVIGSVILTPPSFKNGTTL